MKKSLLVLFGILAALASTANAAFTSEQLIEKAKAFVAAKNARQQPNSTIKEIDAFISLLAENFIDEHVKYNFTYTDKAKLREDMINKLKDDVIQSAIEIEEMMVGANVVIIKMTEFGKVKPAHLDKTIEYNKTNILSLEFDPSGLVKHIRRHHG